MDKLICGHPVSEVDRLAIATTKALADNRECLNCQATGILELLVRYAVACSATELEVMACIEKLRGTLTMLANIRLRMPETQQHLSEALHRKRRAEIADSNAKLGEQLSPLGIDIGPILSGME